MMRWMLASVMVGVLGCGAEETSGVDTADVGDTSSEPDETATEVSSCVGLVCDAPPAATCVSASTLRVWAAGVCAEPAGCAYEAYVDKPCAAGCEAGACKGDPCAGITCDAPPDDCHAATGTCHNGVCSYAARDGDVCDDGDPCTNDDRCNNGCGGRQVACTTPPPDACEDGTTLVVHPATGTCGADGCSYSSQRVACANGCVDGACAGDVCTGVVCNTPPSGCHQATGICVSGICRYEFDDGATCDDEDTCSTNDQCEAGVCVGMGRLPCTTPPAATCTGNTLSVPAATGACAAGQCSYDVTPVTCQLGCAASGTACAGDPCAGVVCNAPPAATCIGNVRHVFSGGTCNAGTCAYSETTQTCTDGCSPSGCLAPAGVVISEVLYDAVGADDDVFVELHGTPGASLAGLTLIGRNGNGGNDYQSITLSGTFDSSGLFVIADPNAAPWIADMADQLAANVDYQNGPDSIQLRSGADVVDALGYGTFTTSDVFMGEGTAHPGIDVPGQSLARADYRDTNDNAADFAIFAKPTPGGPNVVDTTLDDCAGKRVTWGTAGCGADLVAAEHGAVVTLTSDAGNTTGAATATCNDATWVVSGTSCAEATNALITISGGGLGSGVVNSDLPGLGNCSSGTCRAPYSGERDVTFTALPDAGSVVVWLAQPTCAGSNTCVVHLNGVDSMGVAVRFELDAGWQSVAVGATFTYGVRADGSLWGWGRLHLAITGAEQEEHRPVRIGSLDGWERVATYRDRVCGLMDGFLYCWGALPIGDGTGEYRRDPVRLRNNETWLAVVVGLRHTCAIDTTDRLFCWGSNGSGQVGLSPTGSLELAPRQVLMRQANRPNDDWQALALGDDHTCGATSSAVWCWGSSANGQYTGSGFDVSAMPVYQQTMPVPSLLAAGQHHTCTLDTETQRVRCYGNNSDGQLGSAPGDIGANTLVGWTQIDAAGDSTCGVLAGKLYCFGELGDGPEAKQMGTRSNWRMVDLGYGTHQCAIGTAGELYCWGNNDVGQLGDGTTTAREASDMVLITP